MTHKLRSPLKPHGKKVSSQNDEDGIIQAIFEDIPPRSKFFVEFGIGPNWQDPTYSRGLEGNCVLLKEQGWDGVFMDGGSHPESYDIKKEFVTSTGVNSLFRKHHVPLAFDLLSIDVDGQDYWIWSALDYMPSVVIIEMNPNFLNIWETLTVTFDTNFRWDGTKYYGASLGALCNLGRDKGYKLVYANGVNAFFVRSTLLANPEDFDDKQLLVFADQHVYDHFRRPWVTV